MSKRMVVAGMLAAGVMMVPVRAQVKTLMPVRAQVKTLAGDLQEKDELFAGTEKFAKNASDVTEVTMDPESLGMVSGKDKDKAHGMKLSVVRTYTYDKPGMYDMADVEAYRAKLMSGEWHCSVHVRSLKTGESTDVCNKKRSDDMVESAIITVEPKSLTFIHTIKQRSQGGSYDNESSLGGWPLTMGAEMQARMAVMGAEMQARMAGMQPEMMTAVASMKAKDLDLGGLKLRLGSMKLPNADELQREMDGAMRGAERSLNPPKPE